MSSKADEAASGQGAGESAGGGSRDAPPAYAQPDGGPSPAPETRPTADSPFDFPDIPPPAYPASEQPRIAIPQVSPKPTAVFLAAYSPVLLSRGIPLATWLSFLDTVSAFLAAKVSDRALSHAADISRRIGKNPSNLAKGLYSHVKNVGKGIGNNAKKGNVIGAALGVVGGAVSIPLRAAFGTVGAAVQLPGSAVAAVTKKPKTPRERAVAYLAAANSQWLDNRGLHVSLVDSRELAQSTGISVASLVGAATDRTVERQLAGLEAHSAKLEVHESATLELGEETLWLVVG